AMEIVWGNHKLRKGDWKHLENFWGTRSFPHYTANGGHENTGQWHEEKVNLLTLYSGLWGDPRGARLTEIALFCDTDQTGGSSIAYFAEIRVEQERRM
ncbi:MAG: DUF3047 domain-containing protein, partial [Deltaproteobacteria bacterium]|nr:DUF3047 domain-containing protein [Deltaproteobacteria bacterium]